MVGRGEAAILGLGSGHSPGWRWLSASWCGLLQWPSAVCFSQSCQFSLLYQLRKIFRSKRPGHRIIDCQSSSCEFCSRTSMSTVRGKDVFVSLSTGARKSLCFAVLPYLFDLLKSPLSSVGELAAEERSSIVVVMSPLISLIKSQSSVRVVQLVHSKEASRKSCHMISNILCQHLQGLHVILLNTWLSRQSDWPELFKMARAKESGQRYQTTLSTAILLT